MIIKNRPRLESTYKQTKYYIITKDINRKNNINRKYNCKNKSACILIYKIQRPHLKVEFIKNIINKKCLRCVSKEVV